MREKPYGYTGEWYGGYTELLHLRARWYSPGEGVFLSRDPVESEPPYQYVRGNPIRYRDPRGWFAEGDIEKFVRQRGISFFSLTTKPPGFELWLIEALKHPLVDKLLYQMKGRIQPTSETSFGEFDTERGGTLSNLYQATRNEATALLIKDGLCGITDIHLEAAHLSLIVLAGIPVTEHYQYRPKPTWEHYPVLMPDGRSIYEPGWDKVGHFFNHAFLTFEYLYSDDRRYPEARDLSMAAAIVNRFPGREMVSTLESAYYLASFTGQPYESSINDKDITSGNYTWEDKIAFDISKIIGHIYEFVSTPFPFLPGNDLDWWTKKEFGGEGREFERGMITQGLADQGLWRDLTANRRGAKFGIQVYHNPILVP